VSKLVLGVALAAVSALGACKKTGEGEYQVKGPAVEKQGDTIRIDTGSATVRTPTVDVGTKKDTLVVDRPTVDVKTPGERKADSARKKRP
jgi:hypothetical protein